MRRACALLVVGLVLAGCGSSISQASPTEPPSFSNPFVTRAPPTRAPGATPTWRPTGCAFFLLITNATATNVTVSINNQAVGGIEPGHVMRQPSDRSPKMPWDVVISRETDGHELASRHYEPAPGTAYLTVTDESVATRDAYC